MSIDIVERLENWRGDWSEGELLHDDAMDAIDVIKELRAQLQSARQSELERCGLCTPFGKCTKHFIQSQISTQEARQAEQEPVAWVRMKDGKIDWAEDCLYASNKEADFDQYEGGYTCVPLFTSPITNSDAVDAVTRKLQAYPTLAKFFDKHALGSKVKPSCLACGSDKNEIATRHLELPDIYICDKCVEAIAKDKAMLDAAP